MKRIKCIFALLMLIFLFFVGTVDAQQKQSIKESKIKFRLDESVKTGNTLANKKTTALQGKKAISQQTIKVGSKPKTGRIANSGDTDKTAKKYVDMSSLENRVDMQKTRKEFYKAKLQSISLDSQN